jgi:hypothetical protein
VGIENIIQSKNQCLQKFLLGTEKFLELYDLGSSPDINELHQFRESMIKTIHIYDKKVGKLINDLQPTEKTSQLIETVRALVHEQDNLIQAILLVDKKIIQRIEEEKEQLLKELSTSDRQKEIVRKFKSTWVPEAGEKLDGTI